MSRPSYPQIVLNKLLTYNMPPHRFEKGNIAWKKRGHKKKKTLAKEAAIKLMEKMLVEKFPQLTTAKLDLALGCWIKDVKHNRVYLTKPDVLANEQCLQKIAGKPILRTEHSWDERNLQLITESLTNLSLPKNDGNKSKSKDI